MKLTAYLLAFLLLTLIVAAQDIPDQKAANDEVSQNVVPGRRIPLTEDEAASIESENRTCFAIRAYLFELAEDGVMRPVGMTTCVPHNPRNLKKIQKKLARPAPLVRLTY